MKNNYYIIPIDITTKNDQDGYTFSFMINEYIDAVCPFDTIIVEVGCGASKLAEFLNKYNNSNQWSKVLAAITLCYERIQETNINELTNTSFIDIILVNNSEIYISWEEANNKFGEFIKKYEVKHSRRFGRLPGKNNLSLYNNAQ